MHRIDENENHLFQPFTDSKKSERVNWKAIRVAHRQYWQQSIYIFFNSIGNFLLKTTSAFLSHKNTPEQKKHLQHLGRNSHDTLCEFLIHSSIFGIIVRIVESLTAKLVLEFIKNCKIKRNILSVFVVWLFGFIWRWVRGVFTHFCKSCRGLCLRRRFSDLACLRCSCRLWSSCLRGLRCYIMDGSWIERVFAGNRLLFDIWRRLFFVCVGVKSAWIRKSSVLYGRRRSKMLMADHKETSEVWADCELFGYPCSIHILKFEFTGVGKFDRSRPYQVSEATP